MYLCFQNADLEDDGWFAQRPRHAASRTPSTHTSPSPRRLRRRRPRRLLGWRRLEGGTLYLSCLMGTLMEIEMWYMRANSNPHRNLMSGLESWRSDWWNYSQWVAETLKSS